MTREEALSKAIDIISYFEMHFAKSKEARDDAVNIIEALEQEPQTEWIPCSERLPKDHDWYLIVVKKKSTGYQHLPRVASHLQNNDWYLIDTEDADKDWLDDLECIAWCPLPEPYKESEVSK